MPTSEARIRANRANSARSTGPTSDAGKSRSRGNALKHGMTGAGVVLPESDAAEVAAMTAAVVVSMGVVDDAGLALARRFATLSVRMNRCVAQENAAITVRVRQTLDEFVPPEGVTPEEAEALRSEAGCIALFDPSPEAERARKYEAAAERGFYRALKELRQLRRENDRAADASASVARAAASVRTSREALGSFSPGAAPARPLPAPAPAPRVSAPAPAPPKPAPAPAKPAPAAPKLAPRPGSLPLSSLDLFTPDYFELPIRMCPPR